MTDQPTQDAIVSQRDREFAAVIWRDYVAKVGEVIVARCMRDGELDDGLPSILATYRAEIEAATIERCAGVCDAHAKAWGLRFMGWATVLATAIRNLKCQTS